VTAGIAERFEDGGTRARLLTEAARLFCENGYPATSVRDIATAMNWTSASLYHHVPSKEHLLFEVAVVALTELRDEIEKVLGLPVPAHDRLRLFIAVHCRVVLERKNFHATVLVELKHLTGDAREVVMGFRDDYERRLDDLLTQAHAEGSVRTADVKFQRLALLNLLNWPLIWYRPDGQYSPFDMGQGLADVFLNGVSVAPRSQFVPQLGAGRPLD
jgi:AcrR family transcriptional regulator